MGKFEKIDFDFDSDYKTEMAPTMIRQKHKMQLLQCTGMQLEYLFNHKLNFGKKFNKVLKDLLNDYFKGVKKINKKNPVFIEMPKLVAVGKDTGQIKRVYEGQNPQDADVEVHPQLDTEPMAQITNPDNVFIEDKK